jgi:acid phosphatase
MLGAASCGGGNSNDETARSADVDARLNGVLWIQTALEYEIATVQAYELAEIMLLEGMADYHWTALVEQEGDFEDLPPAVVLDVDETVLDNSAYDARLIIAGIDHDQNMWNTWVTEKCALAISGAKGFLESAVSRGVKIFFITNRDYNVEMETAENLRVALGLEVLRESVLCRGEKEDWDTDKTSRRAFVARTHRVLLLIGDDLNDFVYVGNVPPEERVKLGRRYADYWGKKWIVLPNPVYGTWERATYGYDNGSTRAERLNKKYAALRVGH